MQRAIDNNPRPDCPVCHALQSVSHTDYRPGMNASRHVCNLCGLSWWIQDEPEYREIAISTQDAHPTILEVIHRKNGSLTVELTNMPEARKRFQKKPLTSAISMGDCGFDLWGDTSEMMSDSLVRALKLWKMKVFA